MSKQASLLKWGLNNKNSLKGCQKHWIHSSDALISGHVAYLVKFLGKTEASQPKGIEAVKESIKKLKFNNQLKLSEGSKLPKVELTVSVDGVSIQDPKTKKVSYQYPLHQISYCADDKSDKKLFSFIAKEPGSDKHSSFVFASDRWAEEITLTIGQAFDLAYRRFLETSGKELETRQKLMILQKKVQDLEAENKKLCEELNALKQLRMADELKNKKATNNVLVSKTASKDVCPPPLQPPPPHQKHAGKNILKLNLLEFKEPVTKEKCIDYLEDIRDLENAYNANTPQVKKTAFNETLPQSCLERDPFGMGNFSSICIQEPELKNSNESDRRLLEMRDGFQRGISFGNDDFFSEF